MQTTKRGSCLENRSNNAPPGRFLAPPRLSKKPSAKAVPQRRRSPWERHLGSLAGAQTDPFRNQAAPSWTWRRATARRVTWHRHQKAASESFLTSFAVSKSVVREAGQGKLELRTAQRAFLPLDDAVQQTRPSVARRRILGAQVDTWKAISLRALTSRLGGSGGWGRFRISKGGGGGGSYLQTLPSEPSLSTQRHRLNRRKCCTTHSALTFFEGSGLPR